MKKIPLKTVEMRLRSQAEDDKPITLSYAETLLIVLDTPPRDGFSIAEMRKRLPITDKIEAAQEAEAEHVLLEDAQHKTLAALVRDHRFRLSHYAILEMIDAVEGAPDVEVEAKDAD